jgi:Big-like domain-containing protein
MSSWKTTFPRRAWAFVAVALILSSGALAQDRDPVSDGVASAVLLAKNSIQVDRDTVFVSGDLVVNNAASGAIYGERQLSLDRDGTTPAGARLVASGIDIDTGTKVGSVFYNTLANAGTILGSQNTPLALPVFAVLPALLDRTAGSQNVAVANGATLHIVEGDYAALTVGVGSTAIFDGGGYAFTSISVSRNAVIRFAAPSSVVVKGRVSIDRDTNLGPAAGVSASAIQIHVHGINGSTGALTATPSSVEIARNCTISANVNAPNGSIVFDRDAIATGSFLARDILIGRNSRFTLGTAYNQAPSADPQRVFTSGTSPLAITLTGSDPDGQALTFAIDSAPAHGSLSAVTPLSPSTASVTYTASGSGDVLDSFSFRVTDPSGATGAAVVSINPTGDDPEPPPATTVVANDSSTSVVRDTATLLALTADAPTGVTRTFTIVSGSGPSHGSLGAVMSGDPTTVTYAPDSGYVGSDAFQFQACGVISSTTVCDIGTVSITVLEKRAEDPSLAADVEVATQEDTGVLISLSGDSTESSVLRLQPLAAFLQQADVAGNVADSNADAAGDNHNALPGSVPLLMSAGVSQSGGAGSNGTVRMQIEFDLSSAGPLSSSLQTATVHLHTHRGTVDSLDTKFFALAADNDGLLTDSDFAGTGELVTTMPVPSLSAMPIGSDSTFSFDVIGELRAAIAAGHSILAIQGRVDESLAGPARGLEVYTSADGNDTSFLVPELQLTTPGVLAPRTFTVLSLPANGSLYDGNGILITAVPYTLPDARVTYAPATGFIGTNTFAFRVSQGLAFADATATIHVTFSNCATTAAGCNNGR